MEEKTVTKKKKSSLCAKGVVGLYVCAGLSLICGLYMLYYSITYVQSYYESYGMSISEGIKDVLQYVVSSSGSYVGFAILLFTAAIILKKVDRIYSCCCGQAEQLTQSQESAVLSEALEQQPEEAASGEQEIAEDTVSEQTEDEAADAEAENERS